MAHKGGPQIFVYRSERLPEPDWERRTVKLVEDGRRAWRVAAGDLLLFTEGRGLALRFVAYSEVLEVERERIRDDGLTRTVVTLQRPSSLPDGLLLHRFMYSLRAVTNFRRPWLHLRHKSRLSNVDFDALVASRIEWKRTVFFGLLRELPLRWREFLENESWAHRVASDIAGTGSPARLDVPPVLELLALVETTLIAPARLAGDVHTIWAETFGVESIETVQVVEPDGRPESWDMVSLLRWAAQRGRAIEDDWLELRDLTFESSTDERRTPWRPHRW